MSKSKKTRKKKWWEEEWEQVWKGVSSSEVSIIDPETEQLPIGCCDCGATHLLDMTVLEGGKIRIRILAADAATRYLRKTDNLEFRECRKCKKHTKHKKYKKYTPWWEKELKKI